MNAPLAALLSDLDGTLVDGERLWADAHAEVARQLGGELTAAELDALVGVDLDVSVATLCATVAHPPHPDEVRGLLLDAVAAGYRDGYAPPMPGALDLLNLLAAVGVPVAVVTSTVRPLAELAIARLGRHRFAAVVCGDEAGATKPDPHPYRRAAQLLGVDPRACLAVEDSPTGVLSAHRAGAPVLAVPGALPVRAMPGCTVRAGLVGITLDEIAAARAA